MPAESHRFHALGTSCAVFGVGLPAAKLERAAAWVGRMHERFTRFEPESELSRLNAGAGAWFPVSDELEQLLREALSAWELSGGLVNAAVLPAMLAIGYTQSLALGPGRPAGEPGAPLPPLPEVLEVVPGRARLEPGAGIDLGGIAKGWLADRLSDRLGENCLVNLGGDLFARGEGPEGEGWPVGFGGTVVLLRDQGAATSSTRNRAWGAVHHLIDPRTGRPAQSDVAEVSVVAASATTAECLAKTALLLGGADAPAFLAAHAAAWWLA
jgi:thiamine biosynthesis lipoprotein